MFDFPVPDLPLQAVVFDLDGLMFNTEDIYQEAGSTILARRGCEFTPELLKEMMGRQTARALQIMIDWHQLSDTVDSLAKESMEVIRELVDTRLQPMPGLRDLLSALEAAAIPKGIATGSTREFLDRVLTKSSLSSRFTFTIAGSEIEHGKPAPDIYLFSAQKLGCPPQQMMVLEDSQLGCQAAVAADTYAVAVPSGASQTQAFSGVKFVADTLADPRIYDAMGLRRSDV